MVRRQRELRNLPFGHPIREEEIPDGFALRSRVKLDLRLTRSVLLPGSD